MSYLNKHQQAINKKFIEKILSKDKDQTQSIEYKKELNKLLNMYNRRRKEETIKLL